MNNIEKVNAESQNNNHNNNIFQMNRKQRKQKNKGMYNRYVSLKNNKNKVKDAFTQRVTSPRVY